MILRHKRVRGFTLTELAIVIGVIGILTAAIWTFIGPAYENTRHQQLAEQLSTVVNHVRALYAGQAGISGAAATLTPQLVTQGAIPTNTVRSGAGGCTNNNNICVDGPWGPGGGTNSATAIASGSLGVCDWTAGVPAGANCATQPNSLTSQFFAVELRGLSFASCVVIAPQNSASGAPPGLLDVVINGVSIMGAPGVVAHSLPVQFGDAKNLCNSGPGGNTVDFVYRLQQPAY